MALLCIIITQALLFTSFLPYFTMYTLFFCIARLRFLLLSCTFYIYYNYFLSFYFLTVPVLAAAPDRPLIFIFRRMIYTSRNTPVLPILYYILIRFRSFIYYPHCRYTTLLALCSIYLFSLYSDLTCSYWCLLRPQLFLLTTISYFTFF